MAEKRFRWFHRSVLGLCCTTPALNLLMIVAFLFYPEVEAVCISIAAGFEDVVENCIQFAHISIRHKSFFLLYLSCNSTLVPNSIITLIILTSVPFPKTVTLVVAFHHHTTPCREPLALVRPSERPHTRYQASRDPEALALRLGVGPPKMTKS